MRAGHFLARFRLQSSAIALIYFVVGTLLFTYPLVGHFNTHVLGWNKLDSYEILWLFRWVPHALFDLGTSPWFVPNIYYPFGYHLVYGEVTPLHSFGLLPITMLFGEIVTYNVVTVISTSLTGWTTFLLARTWIRRLDPETDRRLLFVAALFAGSAFAFCAYRMLKLTGHLNLFNTQWLTLGLYFWDRVLCERHHRSALWTGICLGLAALSSWYYGLLLGIALVFYTTGYTGGLRVLLDWRMVRNLGVIGLIAFVMCLPFLLPYVDAPRIGTVPLADASFWSASITDYLLPNPYHPFWKSVIAPLAWPFPTPILTEFVVPIGLVTLALVLWGSRHVRGPNWRGLKWLILGGLILSLGPFLHISRLPTPIPLPALLLRELPIFSSLRTWIRFAMLVFLGTSLLAGAALYVALRAQQRHFRAGLALAVLLLMMFESWSGGLGLVPVEPRPVDLWLAEQPDPAPIMEYPLSTALSGPSLFYTQYHRQPITYGYGTFFEFYYRDQHPELASFPADAALDTLESWGVRYILVTTTAYAYDASFTPADIARQSRLELVTTLTDVEVYRLQPTETVSIGRPTGSLLPPSVSHRGQVITYTLSAKIKFVNRPIIGLRDKLTVEKSQ